MAENPEKMRAIAANDAIWELFKRITELEYGTHRRYKSKMLRKLIQEAWDMKYKYKDQIAK